MAGGALTSSLAMSATENLSLVADTIFVNGRVVTMDATDTVTQAVAVKDDWIMATGTDEAIRLLNGPQTNLIDLAGRTMTPGLIDAHVHAQLMGHYSRMVPFVEPDVDSIRDMKRKLTEVVAHKGKGEWIWGRCVFQNLSDKRMPTRQELDEVSPDNPVWIMHQTGHAGVANSLALSRAGISSKTPDPVGGIIQRDMLGEPTGRLFNLQATDLIIKHIPAYSLHTVKDNILSFQPSLVREGVTTLHDIYVRPPRVIDLYLDLGKRGQMKMRGAIYYALEHQDNLRDALNISPYKDKSIRFAGFKFIMDGQADIAFTHQPHNGLKWNIPTWDRSTFKRMIRSLHDTGLQISVHTLGDAALDFVLDAYEEAMNANPRDDPRHRIEHCLLCTPEATKRMKDLGVVVVPTPTFIRNGGDIYRGLFGESRMSRLMVTRDWLEAGIPIALGPDAPAMPWHTPQMTMWCAMNRRTKSDHVIGPEQRLSLAEVFRSYTMGGAYAAHEEKIKGSIEAGKLADFAVWSKDPYSIPPEKFNEASVDMTVIGGAVAYQREN